MNVLVVSSYPPRHCGVGAYARAQATRLRNEGHEVTVLSPPDGEGDIRTGFQGGGAFRRAARIGGRFDRIVVHYQPALYYRRRRPVSKVMTSLSLVVLGLLRSSRLEVLVHEADPPVRWRPDYLLLSLAFRIAGRVAFHTETEWRSLERDYGVRVRGAIVAHEVEPAARPSREEARRALGIAVSHPVFVAPGFLQPSKGLDRAIRAFAVADGGASLYVVGSVRDRTPENEAFAHDLRELCRATPGVTFVERYVRDDEFDRWVAAADWVVLPYRRSWSSGVLARAQALGTRSIVAAVGGLPEQAGHDDVVFVDDQDLVRAMREAASGRPPRSPGAARAARTAGPPFTSAVPHAKHDTDWDPFSEPPAAGRKEGRTMLLVLIIVSVLLAALAQLTLKHGMNQVSSHGAAPLSLSEPVETIRRIASNASVWTGLATFAVSAGIWLVVLSRASLSFAYPFASLTYVMILMFDRFVLKDEVPLLRWGGVVLIITGLLLISRTPHN